MISDKLNGLITDIMILLYDRKPFRVGVCIRVYARIILMGGGVGERNPCDDCLTSFSFFETLYATLWRSVNNNKKRRVAIESKIYVTRPARFVLATSIRKRVCGGC